MRAAAIPPVILAAALLAPGGCGTSSSDSSDKFKGREKQVAEAIDDLGDAARKRDSRKICDSLLTPAVRDRLAQLAKVSHRGTDCADQLEDSLQDATTLDLKVESISISGNTATARVKSDLRRGKDPVDTLELEDQRGWRISKLP
jgi:hypothetical protein